MLILYVASEENENKNSVTGINMVRENSKIKESLRSISIAKKIKVSCDWDLLN